MAEPSPDRPRYEVLSQRTITVAGLALVFIGVGLAVLLIWAYGGGGEAERTKLDAIRTAGTIVVGAGGAGALWLAARKQRTTEISLQQKEHDQRQIDRAHALNEQTAANTRHDAVERLVTELYGKAVEQLGSDKASVRTGGLFALERLAQNVLGQRQTIVNVMCAYLQMPLPEDDQQETKVRERAQAILVTHLRPDAGESFWENTDLDLSGARLTGLDLTGCRVRRGVFDGCHLSGTTSLRRAEFGALSCTGAVIAGEGWFDELTVTGETSWQHTRFADAASFGNARLHGRARFDHASFAGQAVFAGAEFGGDTTFDDAVFRGDARFQRSAFGRMASFDGAGFAQQVWFTGACFAGEVAFDGIRYTALRFDEVSARADVPGNATRAWPPGYSLGPGCPVPRGRRGTWARVVGGGRGGR
jgi:uncharacterized protein YjbI with pentapeptide repeats